jgi:hypothetical protein
MGPVGVISEWQFCGARGVTEPASILSISEINRARTPDGAGGSHYVLLDLRETVLTVSRMAVDGSSPLEKHNERNLGAGNA